MDFQFNDFRLKKNQPTWRLYYGRAGKRLVGGIARKKIVKSQHLIDTWKVMVSAAYGERGARPAMVLGPSFIAESPSVCTQTYLFFCVDSKEQAESLQSYLNTRFSASWCRYERSPSTQLVQLTLGFHSRYGTTFGPTKRCTRNIV